MIELGELEKHHAEFAKRQVRIFVIANDEPADAQEVQKEFPHLHVVADTQQKLAKAVEVLHVGVGPKGSANAPTTILLDSAGNVAWLFRPTDIVTRLPAAEVLAAIDANLKNPIPHR